MDLPSCGVCFTAYKHRVWSAKQGTAAIKSLPFMVNVERGLDQVRLLFLIYEQYTSEAQSVRDKIPQYGSVFFRLQEEHQVADGWNVCS